jgi:hypothetical protein
MTRRMRGSSTCEIAGRAPAKMTFRITPA